MLSAVPDVKQEYKQDDYGEYKNKFILHRPKINKGRHFNFIFLSIKNFIFEHIIQPMKTLLLALLLCATMICHAQGFIVTSDGLRSEEDTSVDYVIVDADGITAAQLYDSAVAYVRKKVKGREKAIKDKSVGEYLEFKMYKYNAISFDTGRPTAPVMPGGPRGTAIVSYDAKYIVQVMCFEGQAQVSFREIEFVPIGTIVPKLVIKGGDWKTYTVYDDKGKLADGEIKDKMEKYFNSVLFELSDILAEGI